jgi:cytochrome P450
VALVILALAAANDDERHFADPEQLKLTRSPNKHLAFRWGACYCVGAPFARLEEHVAMNTFAHA